MLALHDLSDVLIESATRTLRLAVEGSSTPKGRVPNWVKRSVEFVITGLHKGSTTIALSAPRLGDTALEELRQQDLWNVIPEPHDTALTVLARAFRDVENQDTESERYDMGTLRSLARFGELVRNYGTTLEITNGIADGPLFTVEMTSLDQVENLIAATPEPRAAILAGWLEGIEHSTRAFKLLTEDKEQVRGRVQGGIAAEDLRSLWGKRVTVKGMAHFTASGRMRLIEADLMRPFEQGDSLFERSKRRYESTAPSHRSMQRKGVDFLGEIWNTWPGDESVEELLERLSEGAEAA